MEYIRFWQLRAGVARRKTEELRKIHLASLLLALTAAPAARAAPTGRTKHHHELEADLHELEKMLDSVLGRSFDKTNPNV